MATDHFTALQRAFRRCQRDIIHTGLFSMFINLLMLGPPLYMLQVYDRVIPTQSTETLIMLTLLIGGMFLVMGSLEIIRSRLMVRIGNRFDTLVNERLFDAMFQRSLVSSGTQDAQPLNDLASLRQFMTGSGLFAFFDAPWIPVYIAVLFLFDTWFGVFALMAGAVLLTMAIINEYATRGLLADAGNDGIHAQTHATAQLRNAEVLHAMGMLPALRTRWATRHRAFLVKQSRASDRAGTLANASKVLRMLFQSLILGLGAWLVINGELSAGMMIAGSILMGRALAPIDQMINAWKGFVGARTAFGRLQSLLRAVPEADDRMRLPTPVGQLRLEAVSAAPPGTGSAVLRGLNAVIEPGEQVGIIGPSGSGKSTLARVLLGIWPAQVGTVRLDGADISQWPRDELGPHIGYLPQDIELFDGTISDNIARFGEVDADKVVEAARRAGVHDMILAQPDGYDTWINASRGILSGGQRQRLGLARALYGSPRLIVLDEPNSNLDDSGERALVQALSGLRDQGTTLFVISHRASILAHVDKLMVIKEGQLTRFGPREEVAGQFARRPQRKAADPSQPAAGRTQAAPGTLPNTSNTAR